MLGGARLPSGVGKWLSSGSVPLQKFILLLKIPFVLGLKVKLKFHLGTNQTGTGFQPSLERILLSALFPDTQGSLVFKAAVRSWKEPEPMEQHAGVTALVPCGRMTLSVHYGVLLAHAQTGPGLDGSPMSGADEEGKGFFLYFLMMSLFVFSSYNSSQISVILF